MKLIVDVEDEKLAAALAEAIAGSYHNFHVIHRKLDKLLGIESHQSVDLTRLADKVAVTQGLSKSIKVLVEEIANEINSQPGMEALSEKLRASAAQLEQAVQANSTE